MQAITATVGRGGKNKPVDVVRVQVLFNANGIATTVDGDMDYWLESKIEAFQRDVMKLAKPDARISPGGRTWTKLNAASKANQDAAVAASVLAPIDESTVLVNLDSERFAQLYERQFALLAAARRNGLIQLIDFMNADPDLFDVRWGAYMLATVKHECAERWQPIEEFGKGSGKSYGNAVKVKDAEGKEHSNVYYGRGYVQLTWKDNYQKIGQALGLGDDLMIHPEKALEAEISYKVMSYGMRHGTFTGKKLADFISGKKLDYRNARKIINGLDKADLIKGYAEALQILLLLSLKRTSSRLPADHSCTRR